MKKLASIILIIIILISVLSTTVFADDITSAMSNFQNSGGNSSIISMGGKILAVVQAIGVAVAVVMIVIIAIKIMITAPGERAEIKKQVTPYIIGASLLFGGTAILQIAKVLGDKITKLG